MRFLSISIAVAVVYCYYNWQLFQYEREMLNIKKVKSIYVQIAFLLNYVLFVGMSVLELHLCINWTCFLVFFLIENLLIFKCSAWQAYSLALSGTAIGLAVNIFLRCIFAIFLNRSLAIFDNNTMLDSNLKRYPVFLGFLVAGLFFHVIRLKGIPAKIRSMVEDFISLRFLCGLQSILYLYLLLNLLGYYTQGNSFPMKMWGIKSTLFSTLGLILLIMYAVYMSKLRLYQNEIKTKRDELIATKEDEEKIWVVAFTDTLTGCFNRQYAQELFGELEEGDSEVVLCFVDLDGLKTVNDNHGHLQGDRYLRETVKYIQQAVREGQDYIFRYGGDEFLLLFKDVASETVDFRMRKVQKELQQLSNTPEFPFTLSISYGLASKAEVKNLKDAVVLADERMYERKQRRKKARGRIHS